MCLAGAVVASWSLPHEMEGSNPFTVIINILVSEYSKFNENSQGKLKNNTVLDQVVLNMI